MMKKLHLIIKISFFAIVIAVSIFLKEKHFTAYISPGAIIDQTDYLIQFNIFSKIWHTLLSAHFLVYFSAFISSIGKIFLSKNGFPFFIL